MGFLLPEPKLEPGEQIVFKRAANRTQGKRAVGGRLFLTNRRVIFEPNAFDRRTGGKPWSCSHIEIEGIGTAERTIKKPYSGGIRRRLVLHLAGNNEELFGVYHLESVESDLREAIMGHRGLGQASRDE